MRLGVLIHGHRPLQKLQLRLLGLIVGQVPGPIALMSYRRHLFGKPFAQVLQQAMRAATAWRVEDTELFAAFVSKQHQCVY